MWFQALLGQILRTQRHLSRGDIPTAACPQGSTLCYLLLEKNKILMPDIIGDDLPSVLDGTNPRIEGSLDITGAGRESSVCELCCSEQWHLAQDSYGHQPFSFILELYMGRAETGAGFSLFQAFCNLLSKTLATATAQRKKGNAFPGEVTPNLIDDSYEAACADGCTHPSDPLQLCSRSLLCSGQQKLPPCRLDRAAAAARSHCCFSQKPWSTAGWKIKNNPEVGFYPHPGAALRISSREFQGSIPIG